MTESPARISILIVDDEAPIRRLLTIALRAEGYTVRTAADVESALLATRHSMPALVILDLGLPRVSGDDFLRQVRSDGLDVPVIVITASIHGAARAADAGADAYLPKPFDLWELISRVAELTGGPPAPDC